MSPTPYPRQWTTVGFRHEGDATWQPITRAIVAPDAVESLAILGDIDRRETHAGRIFTLQVRRAGG